MTTPVRRITIGAVIFLLTCAAAVTAYVSAGWPLLDAVYMVVITVFGVGYGETHPLDESWLRVFTMGLIIAGCSSAIYVVGGFVQMLAEGEINRALGNRRMSKGIEGLSGHTILCGFGRIGQVLAGELASLGQRFVVLDADPARVQQAQEAGYLAILGSASEEQTLETAGIAKARVLATVLPSDTANVFVALTARELNPSIQIIARAEAASTEKKLLRSGANRVVLPAVIGATKIAHIIARPSTEDLLVEATVNRALTEELQQIGLEMTEVIVAQGSYLEGRAVGEIEAEAGGFVIVAVKTSDGKLLRATDQSIRLNSGDALVILGHQDVLPELTRRAKPAPTTAYRGVNYR